jgi:hypothetical protein
MCHNAVILRHGKFQQPGLNPEVQVTVQIRDHSYNVRQFNIDINFNFKFQLLIPTSNTIVERNLPSTTMSQIPEEHRMHRSSHPRLL